MDYIVQTLIFVLNDYQQIKSRQKKYVYVLKMFFKLQFHVTKYNLLNVLLFTDLLFKKNQ